MRLLSAKRSLQVCFVVALALGSLLLYRAWASPQRVPSAQDYLSQPARDAEAQPLAKSAAPRSDSEGAKTGGSGKAQGPGAKVLTSARGQDLQLREARAKLREIQAELAKASDEAEVARLQRNQRVMSRMVEHMQQQRGVPPQGP